MAAQRMTYRHRFSLPVVLSVLGLLSAPSARAEVQTEPDTTRNLTLEINGYSRWWTTWQSQSHAFTRATGASYNGVDVRGADELHLFGEISLDDRFELGALVNLELGGNTGMLTELSPSHDAVDMTYVFLKSPWGRLSIGAQPSVAMTMQITAPDAAGNVGTDGMLTGGLTVADPGLGFLGREGIGLHNTTGLNTGNNSEKLIYYTPRMEGLVLGLEYMPNGSKNVRGATDLRRTLLRDFFGAAALYSREIGDNIHVNMSSGWNGGKLGAIFNGAYSSADGRTANGASRRWDEWNSGLDLRIGPITVGGSYRRSLDGRQGDSRWSGHGWAWDAGVSYESGPLTVSAQTFQSRMKNDRTLSGQDRLSVYQVSAKYGLGPGVNLLGTVGSAQFYGQDRADATRRNRGWSVMSGVEINF